MRIGVIEDDKEGLDAITDMLKQVFDNPRVSTAMNAKNALRMLEGAAQSGEPFAAIIIDLRIPATGSRGSPLQINHEVPIRAQELFPDAAIVIFTAYAKDKQTRLGELTERGQVCLIEKTEPGAPRRLIDYLRRKVTGTS